MDELAKGTLSLINLARNIVKVTHGLGGLFIQAIIS